MAWVPCRGGLHSVGTMDDEKIQLAEVCVNALRRSFSGNKLSYCENQRN